MSGFTFQLPDVREAGDVSALRTYLIQMQDQLQYALSHIDDENFTKQYADRLEAVAQKTTKVQEDLGTAEQKKDQQFNAVAQQIKDTANEVTEEYSSAISTAQNEIRAEMSSNYVAESEMGTYKEETKVLVLQEVEGELKAYAKTETVEGELNYIREVTNYFEEVPFGKDNMPSLIIRTSQSDIYTAYTSDGFSIYKMVGSIPSSADDVEVAYIRDNQLYIREGVFEERMSLKVTDGYFDFIETPTGLGVQWRGDK